MSDSNYWDKFWKKRISRRRLMSGTLMVGGGLAAATVVGCSTDESGSNGGGGGSANRDVIDTFLGYEDSPYGFFDARRELDPAPTDSRGGTLTYIGFDPVVLDRYDPHQTQFGPMYSNQSAVFSKLYMYRSHDEPTWENIAPDLAESAPEMIGDPNAPTEYVIKLRQGVKFHDTDKIRSNFPDLAGRELTVDDVIFSYDRQRNADSPQWPYYYRSSQYSTIDRLEKVDDYTLRITTKEPVAPFFHFLADTNAMIIPKEIVDMEAGPDGKPWDSVDALAGHAGPGPGDRMIGTGPFIWDSLTFGIEFNAVRNPEWFGWGDPDLGRPYLDGYKATGQGLNDATVESLFTRKEIDTAGFIDNPDWIVNFKNDHPEVEFLRAPTSGWLNTRFKVFCEPFDDWRVRRALHLATDRSQIVQIIGSGVWNVAGPVTKAISYWALPEEELMSLPGYRTDQAGRDEDLQEARQLWEAAGSPEIPQIWFADVPGYISRYAPTYIRTTLAQNLGIDQDSVRYQTVPYSRIAEGLLKDDCDLGGFTWGFDNGWIDLDDWFYPYYITDGPKNSFRVSDPDLDALLNAQRAEFDIDARKEIGYDIQRYVLGAGPKGAEVPGAHCRIDYASPGGGTIAWPYVKNRTGWPWFGNNYWTSEVWFDQSDPSYQGRPG
ncbi:MAG TPA: ABC transporter substrate-binding protein [Dehalococcoidia bacterium]|nr:ABC transporter substrate-binding protein [Dehalococcoidia bacterium]